MDEEHDAVATELPPAREIAIPQVDLDGRVSRGDEERLGRDGAALGLGGEGGDRKCERQSSKVDGETVAEGRVDRTLPYRISLDEGLDYLDYLDSSIFLAASAPAFLASAFSVAPSSFTSTTILRMVPVNLVLLGW
jgi:hypothetical protein